MRWVPLSTQWSSTNEHGTAQPAVIINDRPVTPCLTDIDAAAGLQPIAARSHACVVGKIANWRYGSVRRKHGRIRAWGFSRRGFTGLGIALGRS